jgi:TonB-dependent receptor
MEGRKLMLSLSARAVNSRVLRCGASTLVLGLALLQPTIAYAQDDQNTPPGKPISETTNPNAKTEPNSEPSKNAIVVTGIRAALRSARIIKKNADTVVDSITATDIGAFPDKSVAEALQRIPGITVDRIAAHGDVSHFSAEPSGVIIRGLPQVRSEFNGRDTFSANSSRGLSWSDITPELLAGVDAYKNQTADMIEGGIAGTINLRTRLPFDASGQLIQVGGHMNYNSLAKKWTPDANAFYSNRWQTGIGEFGIMGDIAYSDLKTRNNMVQFGRVAVLDGGVMPGSANVTGTGLAQGTVFAPTQLTDRISDYDRKRTGIAAAMQWRSNDHRWLVTGQYLSSYYSNVLNEHGVVGNFFGIPYPSATTYRVEPGANNAPTVAPGTPDFTFLNSGMIASGTFTSPPDAYFAGGINNDQGIPMFNNCYSWNSWTGTPYGYTPDGSACATNTYGTNMGTVTRYWKDREKTQDFGLNLKWDATDDLHFNLDGQYVKAWVKDYDITVDMNSFADITLDNTGSLPQMSFSPPTNINLSTGGLSNPDNWYMADFNDHREDSKGHEYAIRADGEYDFHTDWLDSLKFGARYADRKQNLQWSTYNWHNFSNTWTGGCQPLFFKLTSPAGTCTSGGATTTFNGYPSGFYDLEQFGQPYFGSSASGTYPFIPISFLAAHGADLFSAEKIGVGDFIPVCDRNGQTPGSEPGVTNFVTSYPTELPNSCYTAGEIGNVDEKTKAAYLELKFGGDNLLWGRFAVRGNIGVRYVDTVDNSVGNVVYPNYSANAALCPPVALVPGGLTGTGAPPPPPAGAPPGSVPPYVYPAYCYETPQQLAFTNGAIVPSVAHSHFHDWLPSFNLRVDITPKWLVRFAASKAISRPDFGLLRNYIGISQNLPTGSNLSDPRWVLGPDGQPIGVNPTYGATAYNPYLKPASAWQFDVSLEHYFGNAGQFSLALFHKNFLNYIQSGTFTVNETNNGVTVPVIVTGPANGKGAKIDGLEVAYSSFFDFLPGLLSGLGIQANYTYVSNHGIPNSGLSVVGSPIPTGENGGTGFNTGTLEGISKHTVNLIGMYEKGRVSARLAYNWRSKFLVTPADCCIGLPIWQKPTGYLDGSIRYRVTDQIELSLEAQNILNTKAVLLQQVTDENSPEGKIILVPESWNEQDRRIILGFRWKMEGHAAPPPPPPPPPPPLPAPAATQTCADGTVVAATATCPAAPPPPPPAPAKPERG